MATKSVLGSDGHRLHLRHVGTSYRILFGVPLVWTTPNFADTRSPLLVLTHHGRTVGSFSLFQENDGLPEEYRQSLNSMLEMVARDPVGQALVFNVMIELFLEHLFGVLPKDLRSGRGLRGAKFPDGVAASGRPSIVGDVLAFFGPVEGQERGSLHPHLLMWLLGGSLPAWFVAVLADEAGDDRLRAWRLAVLRSLEQRLRLWPSRTVESVKSMQSDSVQWSTSRQARRYGSVTDDVCERISAARRGAAPACTAERDAVEREDEAAAARTAERNAVEREDGAAPARTAERNAVEREDASAVRWLASCGRECRAEDEVVEARRRNARSGATSALVAAARRRNPATSYSAEEAADSCGKWEEERRRAYDDRCGPLPPLPCDDVQRKDAHVCGLLEGEVEVYEEADVRLEHFVPKVGMDLEPHEKGAEGQELGWWPPPRKRSRAGRTARHRLGKMTNPRLHEGCEMSFPGYRRRVREVGRKEDGDPGEVVAFPVDGSTDTQRLREDAVEYAVQLSVDWRRQVVRSHLHRCGKSCKKTRSAQESQFRLCRFNFVHVFETMLRGERGGETLLRRLRSGKPLEYSVRVEDSDVCGRQGRVILVRLHPYEGSTSCAGQVGMRCNHDIQALHRTCSPQALEAALEAVVTANVSECIDAWVGSSAGGGEGSHIMARHIARGPRREMQRAREAAARQGCERVDQWLKQHPRGNAGAGGERDVAARRARVARAKARTEPFPGGMTLAETVRAVFADGHDVGFYTTDYGTKVAEVYGTGALAEIAAGLDRLTQELETQPRPTWAVRSPEGGEKTGEGSPGGDGCAARGEALGDACGGEAEGPVGSERVSEARREPQGGRLQPGSEARCLVHVTSPAAVTSCATVAVQTHVVA